jgi:hypothetical protein
VAVDGVDIVHEGMPPHERMGEESNSGGIVDIARHLNRDRFSRQDTPAREKPDPTEIEARLSRRRLGRDDGVEGGGEDVSSD